MNNDCIFCKIIKGEIPCNKIYENDNFMSIANIDCLVKGHTLVISKKHFATILDMPNSLSPELLECIKKTSLKLMKEYDAEGFNIANNNFKVAGQIINHLHFHILPRKKGDSFKFGV